MAMKGKVKDEVQRFELQDDFNLDKNFQEFPLSDMPQGVEWTTEGQTVEGILYDIKEHIGDNDSRIITLKTEKGFVGVWESRGLSRLFDSYTRLRGCTARIVFTGTRKLKGKKQPMKLFQVFLKR
jgi:hypothetical protein